MCIPMPEPICLVENVNGSLHVTDAAIEYLSRNNQPVVVVSVVGLYRTGKSYLMNQLAGKQTVTEPVEVHAPMLLHEQYVNISVSNIESKTKGIWMWCVPHPNKAGHTLMLLDTKGLDDVNKGDSKNDSWIFCLAVLLSSTLVYNSRGTIDNTAIEKLHYVTELAEQIKIKSPLSTSDEDDDEAVEEEEEEEDSQFVQFFPNFIWTVHDFPLDLVLENKGQVTEDEYLDLALTLKKGLSKKDTDYNLLRECIRNYFPTRKFFVLPFPASQDKMDHLEGLDESEIHPKFIDVTQSFCDYVFSVSRDKTVKGGYKVTGRMFGHLVQMYVETISSGNVPCLENAVVAMEIIENEAAVQEGFKLYESEMEQVKRKFPVSLDDISAEHQRINNMACSVFIKHSFKEEKGEYFIKLKEAVYNHYAELIVQNMEASEKKCHQILTELYEEMNVCVQQRKYTKPRGYKLYCTPKDNIFTQYHRKPNKEIQTAEVEIIKCIPMPEPICLVENVNGSLNVSEAAMEYLSRNNQPVVVVSVVGLYRTGKSYLMNRLAGKQTGFALGSTIESETKGIWMWCVPHPYRTGHTLMLLDTEGLDDVNKGDSKNDSWIFCLAVLLSSTLVYNSRGTIDNTAVEKLHYVAELAEQIKIKSPSSTLDEDEEEEEEDTQFVQFFPNFIWTVRDFSLDLVLENKGQVTEDEYLDFALTLKKGLGKKDINYNIPRECIRNYFPTRKCFVFPFPASQDKMDHLESLDESEIRPKFMDVAQSFCDYVFSTSREKTVKGGYKVTGRMFGHLVQTYVETISSGKVPCLENAVVAMAMIENEVAVQEGFKLYESEMEQVKRTFPVSLDEISAEHQRISNMACSVFMKRSFKDEKGKYFIKLMEEIDKHYAELTAQNMEASEEKCHQILTELCEEMNVCVQQGKYSKPGGYKLYCTHKDNIITQYHSKPNKGIQAEAVLESFLKGRSAEAKFILQTDEQLTESEKKIIEEKEHAALLEQQCKVEKERQEEMEKLMHEEEVNFQQQLQQLEKKYKEEKQQQQEELNRALESKLAEQKELLLKGFDEKAQQMSLEIKQLKKEQEENTQSREDV